MEFRDYYKTLGVTRQASDEELKRAYRRLARRFHPDVNPGDPQADARFKEINEAYQVLSDPDKRKRYDRFGSNWRQTGSFEEAFRRAGAPTGAGPGGFGGAGFSDFFESLFGSMGFGGQRPGPPPSADVEDRVDITLREVAEGGRRSLMLRTPQADGQVRQERIDVAIPKGVRDGQRLRVTGKGSIRPDGTRGDLYLRVSVTPDSRFERHEADLHTTATIGLSEAMLGANVNVSTLGGSTLTVRVPPETRDGARLRLRGQGLPKAGSNQRGDILVRIRVQFPQDLSHREQALFRELAELRGEQPLPQRS